VWGPGAGSSTDFDASDITRQGAGQFAISVHHVFPTAGTFTYTVTLKHNKSSTLPPASVTSSAGTAVVASPPGDSVVKQEEGSLLQRGLQALKHRQSLKQLKKLLGIVNSLRHEVAIVANETTPGLVQVFDDTAKALLQLKGKLPKKVLSSLRFKFLDDLQTLMNLGG
jgi:hypothetical protein